MFWQSKGGGVSTESVTACALFTDFLFSDHWLFVTECNLQRQKIAQSKIPVSFDLTCKKAGRCGSHTGRQGQNQWECRRRRGQQVELQQLVQQGHWRASSTRPPLPTRHTRTDCLVKIEDPNLDTVVRNYRLGRFATRTKSGVILHVLQEISTIGASSCGARGASALFTLEQLQEVPDVTFQAGGGLGAGQGGAGVNPGTMQPWNR